MRDFRILNYDSYIERALQHFWSHRSAGAGRSNIPMQGFDPILKEIVRIYGDGKSLRPYYGQPKIPSIFRPSKKWDCIILNARNQIVAVIELKSHLGSGLGCDFIQNFNNRVEEALGSATDFHLSIPYLWPSVRKPFVGFFLLLEDHPNSIGKKDVRIDRTYAISNPEICHKFYHNKNIYERWIQCFEALTNSKSYDACGLIFSTKGSSTRSTHAVDSSFADLTFFKTFAHFIEDLD